MIRCSLDQFFALHASPEARDSWDDSAAEHRVLETLPDIELFWAGYKTPSRMFWPRDIPQLRTWQWRVLKGKKALLMPYTSVEHPDAPVNSKKYVRAHLLPGSGWVVETDCGAYEAPCLAISHWAHDDGVH